MNVNETGYIDYSDKIDYEYLNIIYNNKTTRIEQVIKALGTMVLHPQEISDPNNIGQKMYGQPIQRPILEGVNRDKVLNKLVELIVE